MFNAYSILLTVWANTKQAYENENYTEQTYSRQTRQLKIIGTLILWDHQINPLTPRRTQVSPFTEISILI